MENKTIKREEIKSSEGEFLHELQFGYELSPRVSEQILLSAKAHLVREHTLREGQIEVTVLKTSRSQKSLDGLHCVRCGCNGSPTKQ